MSMNPLYQKMGLRILKVLYLIIFCASLISWGINAYMERPVKMIDVDKTSVECLNYNSFFHTNSQKL